MALPPVDFAHDTTAHTMTLDGSDGSGIPCKFVVPAAATGNASINCPHGTAPSTPVDGDVWTTSSGLFVRISGVTVGPLGTGGGGGGAGLGDLIASQTPSGTGSVTFSSISNSYRDLEIRVRGRGTASAVAVQVFFQFNGDTGNNYDFEIENRFGQATGNGVSSIRIGDIPAANAPANYQNGQIITVYDYAQTTFYKHCEGEDWVVISLNNAGMFKTQNGGWWRNTAAITSVTVFLSSGNFVAGSTVSLYGRL